MMSQRRRRRHRQRERKADTETHPQLQAVACQRRPAEPRCATAPREAGEGRDVVFHAR